MLELPVGTPVSAKLRYKGFKYPAVLLRTEKDRIEFLKSPFEMKDEIKAMQGRQWHGFEDKPRKIWSVAYTPRNLFQLEWLVGGNPYEHWEKELYVIPGDSKVRPLYSYQWEGTAFLLTRRQCILAAEMGTGKTLMAIEAMERSGKKDWLWVAPKSGLRAAKREFEKWDLKVRPTLMSYKQFTLKMKTWGDWVPDGVVFDESSRLKTPSTQRTQAAQWLADRIREKHGYDGYIIEMTGTPSPKAPIDWWAQAEIACPGFLKEGSIKAFEHRLGAHKLLDVPQGTVFQRTTWLDDERKCAVCGGYKPDVAAELEELKEELNIKEVPICDEDEHVYAPSINEVALLNDRLDGLAMFFSKEKHLDLPEKIYEQVILEPSSSMMRVAKVIADTASNTMQAMTLLRELSDGFQYREVDEGMTTCKYCNGDKEVDDYYDPEDPYRPLTQADFEGHLEHRLVTCPACKGKGEVPKRVRMSRKVACPKEEALIEQLDHNEEVGRLVVFAGFQGSIDRVTEVCLKYGWDVLRVDGRGWHVMTPDGKRREDPLDYWADMSNQKVVFVAHPQSGGMGLTLIEARTCIYYSNDFNPESRTQSEERIYRPGQNHTIRIIDFIHLPTDTKVLNTLKDNRRLEKMTLGELREAFV